MKQNRGRMSQRRSLSCRGHIAVLVAFFIYVCASNAGAQADADTNITQVHNSAAGVHARIIAPDQAPYLQPGATPVITAEGKTRFSLNSSKPLNLWIPEGAVLHIRTETIEHLHACVDTSAGLKHALEWQASEAERHFSVGPWTQAVNLSIYTRQPEGADVEIWLEQLDDVLPPEPFRHLSFKRTPTAPAADLFKLRTLDGRVSAWVLPQPEVHWEVEGPRIIQLESAVLRHITAPHEQTFYTLGVRLDDKPWQMIHASSKALMQHDSAGRVPHRLALEPRKHWLHIPSGSHVLKIRSQRPLLLKCSGSSESAWLSPFNASRFPYSALVDTLFPVSQTTSIWKDLLRSNETRDGSIKIATRARSQLSSLLPERTRAELNAIVGRSSYWKPLLPHTPPDRMWSRPWWPEQDSSTTLTDLFFTPAQVAENPAQASVAHWSVLNPGQKLRFHAPPEQDLWLRFSVSGTKAAELMWKNESNDSHASTAFFFDPQPTPSPTPEGMSLSGSSASRQWELARHNIADTETLWLPHRRGDEAIMFLPAAQQGSLELPASAPSGVMVAAWKREGIDFSLDAEGYILALKELENPLQTFHGFLRQDYTGIASDVALTGEEPDAPFRHTASINVEQHWLPLKRFLQRRFAQMNNSLPRASFTPEENTRTAHTSMDKLWPRMLERAEIWRNTGQGGLSFLSDLLHANEHYLARQLAFILVRDADSVTASSVVSSAATWMEEGDFLNLATALFHIHGSTESSIILCITLAQQNYYQYALNLGLCLPPEKRPLEPLLRSALALNEPFIATHLLDTATPTLKPAQETLWRILIALSSHQYTVPAVTATSSDTPSDEERKRLEWQTFIHRCLSLKHFADPEEQIEEWRQIHTHIPTPRRWESGHELWHAYARRLDLDLPSQGSRITGVVATEDKSAVLRVAGPVSLRFTLRPLHKKASADSNLSADIFASITSDTAEIVLPMWDNRPVSTLAGEKGMHPGNAEELCVDIPAGMQEITLSTHSLPVWVDVEMQKPLVEVSGIPGNNPASIAAWILKKRPVLLETEPQHSARLWPNASEQTGLDPIPLRSWHLRYASIDTEENEWEFMRKLYPPQTGWNSVDDMDPAAVQAWQNIISRLHHASESLDVWSELAAQTSSMAQRYPYWEKVAQLQSYVDEHTRWKKLSGVSNSGGIVVKELSDWEPQSPQMRLRQRLLPSMQHDQVLLLRGEDLFLPLELEHEQSITIDLEQLHLALAPQRPLHLNWQMNDQPEHEIEITQKQQLEIRAPGGNNLLRFRLKHNWPNQYLAISSPHLQQLCDRSLCARVIQRPITQRTWWRATKESPLEVVLPGPARYRIDRLTSTGIESLDRIVLEHETRLSLAPEKSDNAELYRIFRREAQRDIPQNAPVLEPDLAAVPGMGPLDTAKIFAPDSPQIRKRTQRHKTWFAGTGWRERSLLLEDNRGSNRERFGYIHAGWYHKTILNPEAIRYSKTEAGLRVREHGGPLLHLEHGWWVYPQNSRWSWSAFTDAWLQNPDAARFSFEGPGRVWSTRARVEAERLWYADTIFRHSLEVGAFARVLSDRSIADEWERRIDQDIYSDYKRDHQWGLEVTELLAWRPWLDTRFSSEFGLRTNENMSPDYLAAELNWQQLWHERVSTQLTYRLSHYLDDSDRSSSIWRHTISARINIDLPSDPQRRRWRLNMELRGDPESDTWLAGINLQLFWDLHNRWDNLPPQHLPFKQLRRWLSSRHPWQEDVNE